MNPFHHYFEEYGRLENEAYRPHRDCIMMMTTAILDELDNLKDIAEII